MDDAKTKLLRSILDFVFLAALTVAAPLIVYVDVVLLGLDGIPEISVTEISEEALFFISAVLFLVEARRRPEARGFLVLVGGFFGCLLFRELDFLFDDISRGFWMLPTFLTLAASLTYAMVHRKTILPGFAAFADSRSCVYISIGLLIVILYSRMFGSGQLLWEKIMGPAYRSIYKSIIQEGIELYGYTFIFYGSCLLRRTWPA